MHDLTTDEFKAILAHEYGHFTIKTRNGVLILTQWEVVKYIALNARPSQDEKEGGWVRLMMTLNPAYWLLLLYVMLYFKITNGFSRIREEADIMAMRLYGGKAFGNDL